MERKNTSSQIRSKERVKKFGEVFTAEREVNAMLDLVKEETERLESAFLDPTCGNGNFLVEILRRKLKIARTEEDRLVALKSIYGIDILLDNVTECRERLLQIWNGDGAKEAVENNIVCGDFLKGLSIHWHIRAVKPRRKRRN